ncbi:MAG: TIGR04255 family protein [Candidatus Kapaibacterium sp.]|nr:MAG: TIGR04255 family protein [Candidatus Kapabacteria bacterium]
MGYDTFPQFASHHLSIGGCFMVKIPKKISPCPIANATVEFRFSTDWGETQLFGEFYSRLKDHYPQFEELPIRQIPQHILQKDEALRYQPYYQFAAPSLMVWLGAQVVSFTNSYPYIGWEAFRPKCLDVWNILNELGAIREIERLGLRYVNVFEEVEIFSKTSISPTLNLDFSGFTQKTSYFRTSFRRDAFGCLLQVSNELAELQQHRTASLIDIDISLEKEHLHNSTLIDTLDLAHTIEKELFFGLLQPAFLNTLNPEY